MPHDHIQRQIWTDLTVDLGAKKTIYVSFQAPVEMKQWMNISTHLLSSFHLFLHRGIFLSHLAVEILLGERNNYLGESCGQFFFA